jgi:hypothetical protein
MFRSDEMVLKVKSDLMNVGTWLYGLVGSRAGGTYRTTIWGIHCAGSCEGGIKASQEDRGVHEVHQPDRASLRPHKGDGQARPTR